MNAKDNLIDIPDFAIAADARPSRAQNTAPTIRPWFRIVMEQVTRIPWNRAAVINGLALGLLAIIVYGYWQLYAVQQTLAQTQTDLQALQATLYRLTSDVSATGESLNQSGLAMRSELNLVNSEIRKLWDLANKKNRTAINTHDTLINQLEKQTGALSPKLVKLEQQLKTATAEHLATHSTVTETTSALERVKQQLSQLQQLVTKQQKQYSSVQATLTRQTQAVQSMDAFRAQVNQQLRQLQDHVRALSPPATTQPRAK